MPAPYLEYETQRAAMIKELGDVAPEPLCSRIASLIRPAIVLETSSSIEEPAPLMSKFGGAPDVPVGFEWPLGNQPLSFVAQLRLEELADFDLENRLPKSGLLSFWMGHGGLNAAISDCGVFHFQSEGWQKLELPQSNNEGILGNVRRWFAGDKIVALPPTPLQFDACPSHPYGGAEFYDEEHSDFVGEVLDGAFYGTGHQMFGFPRNIQNDVRDDCATAWNKFLLSPQARDKELSPERDQTTWRDWELLLQIGSDDNAKMMWGDWGAIYFLIRRVDLEAHRFERCGFVFQCH